MSQQRSVNDILSRYKDFEKFGIDERRQLRSNQETNQTEHLYHEQKSSEEENYLNQNYEEYNESLDNSQFYQEEEGDVDINPEDLMEEEDEFTDEEYDHGKDVEDLQNLRLNQFPLEDKFEDFKELPLLQPPRPSKPPKSEAGLRVLQSDLKDTNSRVHKLLIRLRMMLALKAGIPCSIVDNVLNEFNEEKRIGPLSSDAKDILSSASSLASNLKNQLERFVSAMATTFRPGDVDRVYLGFLILHRLLHPFSCDSVLTSTVLLIALAYQVHESKDLQGLFTDIDTKIITSRTIFISDPTTALAWNPLAQPMPVMPNIPNETVFTCLLRLYSIRRDVSCFFRMAWQQAIPSIVAITSTIDTIASKSYCDGIRREDYTSAGLPEGASTSSHSFKNLLAVANRVLECILREDIAQIFPTPARVVCQTLFDVGGIDSLHAYILNFLILPNIIKMLRGDHESIENESVHDKFSVSDLVNQYYNLDHWWPAPAAGATVSAMLSDFAREPFNPVNSLIWLVWRLYSGATLLETSALEILTSQGFFAGGPILDVSRCADQKIRNILVRLQHRADIFCKVLLHGFDINKPTNSVDAPRPKEMLNLLLISKEEMAWISRDIYHEIEVVCPDVAQKRVPISSSSAYNHDNENSLFAASPVTASLAQLLKSYINLDETMNAKITSSGEDLLLLDFNSKPSFDFDANAYSDADYFISSNYDRLYRSLQICSRYEDSLIRMIHAVNRSAISSSHHYIDLQELVDDKSWFVATESSVDCAVREVALYDRHTVTFKQKIKEPFYGLEPSSHIETDNQTAIPIIGDVQYKSRQALHAEMHKTLRFGTSKEAVATGTSIARPSHRVSKVQTKVHDDDFILGNRAQRPRYTKSVIHPASSLLVPTEAHRRRNPIKRPNRFDLDREFMESMRSHQTISTDKFLRKREAIARSRSMMGRSAYNDPDNQIAAMMKSSSQSAQPKPFPAFLRGMLRTNDVDADVDAKDLANMIIQDYKTIFAGAGGSTNPSSITQPTTAQRKAAPIRSHRMPLPPDPFPGTSHLAPTQSLLNRCVLSKDLLDQLEHQQQPYSKMHPRPFRPTGNHIINPLGSGVNYDDQSDDDLRSRGSVTSSGRYSLSLRGRSLSKDRGKRAQYRQRSRSRSRSNSLDSRSSSRSQSRSQSPSLLSRRADIATATPAATVGEESPSLSSPITYHMEVTQPSREYVPINRANLAAISTAPAASATKPSTAVVEEKPVPLPSTVTATSRPTESPARTVQKPHNPSQHPLPRPTPMATAQREESPGVVNIPQPTMNVEAPPVISPQAPAQEPVADFQEKKNDSRPEAEKANEGVHSATEADASSTTPTPVKAAADEAKEAKDAEPLPADPPPRSIPVLASRRLEWNIDDMRARLMEGVRVIKVSEMISPSIPCSLILILCLHCYSSMDAAASRSPRS
jgi:hypothetical protein